MWSYRFWSAFFELSPRFCGTRRHAKKIALILEKKILVPNDYTFGRIYILWLNYAPKKTKIFYSPHIHQIIILNNNKYDRYARHNAYTTYYLHSNSFAASVWLFPSFSSSLFRVVIFLAKLYYYWERSKENGTHWRKINQMINSWRKRSFLLSVRVYLCVCVIVILSKYWIFIFWKIIFNFFYYNYTVPK